MSMPGFSQTIPYALIAALCAALHLGVMMAGEALAVHFAVSVTISFLACVVTGYLLHCRFTFGVAPQRAEFARYVGAMILNYPLTLVAVWLLHALLGLSMLIAAPASTVLLTAYNFLSARWAVSSSRASQFKGPLEQ